MIDFEKMTSQQVRETIEKENENRPKEVKVRLLSIQKDIEKAVKNENSKKLMELYVEKQSLIIFPHNLLYQKIYYAKNTGIKKSEFLKDVPVQNREKVMVDYKKALDDYNKIDTSLDRAMASNSLRKFKSQRI